MLSKLIQSKIHFVGIGGIGMCGLAELLYNLGAQVQGSDQQENESVLHLKKLGIPIMIGHSPQNVRVSDVVVFSSAVRSDNSEIVEARKLGIPVIPRAEALDEVMRLKRSIAVTGTHGKTTTTSLVASAFIEAGAKPTVVVGGRLDLIKSTSLMGEGEWLIAEVDESDGRFLRLSPEYVIITNIDEDHLDHFGSFTVLKKAFFDFALKIPFYGKVILCGDDPIIREVFKDFPKRVVYYGFKPDNDLLLEGEKGVYKLSMNGESLGLLQLRVPGQHNALNAAAAFAICREAGLPLKASLRGLEKFNGVDRRFQFKGHACGVDFYDDYGHHPTEILAVLQASHERFPNRRVVVLFQPHRYSRTKLCWNDFLNCFEQAQQVFIADVYAAGEERIEGIDSKKMAAEIKHTNCQYVGSGELAVLKVKEKLKEGDLFITLGAGDVWKWGEQILELIS